METPAKSYTVLKSIISKQTKLQTTDNSRPPRPKWKGVFPLGLYSCSLAPLYFLPESHMCLIGLGYASGHVLVLGCLLSWYLKGYLRLHHCIMVYHMSMNDIGAYLSLTSYPYILTSYRLDRTRQYFIFFTIQLSFFSLQLFLSISLAQGLKYQNLVYISKIWVFTLDCWKIGNQCRAGSDFRDWPLPYSLICPVICSL